MLDKLKTEEIIKEIMDKEDWTHTSYIEWFDSEANREEDDVWCRFLASGLSTETLTKLLSHFDISITSFDPNYTESKLLPYYLEEIKQEEFIMFEVQVTEKWDPDANKKKKKEEKRKVNAL